MLRLEEMNHGRRRIILAAAPCTAMVFVWSHLTKGDAAYTLVQVSVNDLIMLVLFVPIVQFLVHGASSLTVPFKVLLTSVLVFIVVPLLAGALLRFLLVRKHGRVWFEDLLLPRFAPITIAALLQPAMYWSASAGVTKAAKTTRKNAHAMRNRIFAPYEEACTMGNQ